MRTIETITPEIFEKFVGHSLRKFLPDGVSFSDVDAIRVQFSGFNQVKKFLPLEEVDDFGQITQQATYVAMTKNGCLLKSKTSVMLGYTWKEKRNNISFIVGYARVKTNDRNLHFVVLHLLDEDIFRENLEKVLCKVEDQLRKNCSPILLLQIAGMLDIEMP